MYHERDSAFDFFYESPPGKALRILCYLNDLGYHDPMASQTRHRGRFQKSLNSPEDFTLSFELVPGRGGRSTGHAKALDLADLSFSGTKELPLFYPEVGQIEVPIAVRGGGLLVTGAEGSQSVVRAPLVTFGDILPGGEVKPQRAFRPYWLQ